MRKRALVYLITLCCALPLCAQCKYENKAFKAGESLVYDLYFNWKFVWVKAGSASMSVSETLHEGEPAYRCHLMTRGGKNADKFFVMRDTLESIISKDMVPLYFRKGTQEDKRYKVDEVWYSYNKGKCELKQRYRNKHGVVSHYQHSSKECIYDMLSMLLRARSMETQHLVKGERIRFIMADGNDVEEQVFIYRGKDKFKMDSTGVTYNCLVFSFVEQKEGKEKEVITFYVTDDENHLPVRLDMFLNFGSAKAFLRGATGLRNPSTSIRKR